MLDYIPLGSVPYDERCQQIGKNFVAKLASEEMHRYIRLLQRLFPTWEEVGCYFGVERFDHDFGTYSEVVVWYDDEDQNQVDFAHHVDDNLPSNWEDKT